MCSCDMPGGYTCAYHRMEKEARERLLERAREPRPGPNPFGTRPQPAKPVEPPLVAEAYENGTGYINVSVTRGDRRIFHANVWEGEIGRRMTNDDVRAALAADSMMTWVCYTTGLTPDEVSDLGGLPEGVL